jgi:hypothetical protein
MKIIGCDLHTRYQQIAMLDTDTGELVERRLEHESGEARAFYAGEGAPSFACFCHQRPFKALCGGWLVLLISPLLLTPGVLTHSALAKKRNDSAPAARRRCAHAAQSVVE